MTRVLKRAWIPLVLVIVLAVSGLGVVRLHKIFASQDLNATEAILAGFPSPGEAPLTELLRARLGFLRLEETRTRQAYERALELGGTHDLLLAEAAQAFYLLGFESQAQ